MLLHELKPNHPLKKRKTQVGRGGKRGTTSGHGTKGQKSRSGRRIRPAERDFIQRLPKLRGSGNTRQSKQWQVVNIGDLEKLAKDGIISSENTGEIKILGNGELKKALTIKNIPISKSAQKKVEAAGGKIINDK